MNIVRKPIELEINENQFEMILDFQAAIKFQELYGKSIFIGIDNIVKNQDLMALGCLIASTVKDGKKCVGMDFVNSIDLVLGMPYFMEKIGQLMENSLPEEDEESKKKQTKKKKN